ncbi:uncharacterized protein V6R79_024628 [Siganus canaliculatus]
MAQRDQEKEANELTSSSVASDDEQNQTVLRSDNHEPLWLLAFVFQRYEGETRDDQFHGEGTAWFEGGHTYKGMFSKGLMDGSGVFTRADGLKYEGEFVSNTPIGQGTYTWPDGSSYVGMVYKGLRHGSGTYKCATNGVSYRGQWSQGKKHGKGVMFYNQDKTSWYKGDWVKNDKEGWGVRRYPFGNIYSGGWKNNLRHGVGTMKWFERDQLYVGMWENGVQHGPGTHTWLSRKMDGPLDSQYMGDFVQGQKHGRAVFYSASGAIYEGEWSNNQRQMKGKVTLPDGRVFEGEHVDEQMKTISLNGRRVPLHCQVSCEVKTFGGELKLIYHFYSRLGLTPAPYEVFMLTRLQLWRLLKDCKIHHHDITLAEIDRLISEDATTPDIHYPFTPIHLHRLIRYLVVMAQHVYHKDQESLAVCFSKLMMVDILPNAKKVKGFLFKQPHRTVVAMKYSTKCWEIYQAHCNAIAAAREDQTMTCRQLLWMFKNLHLLDVNLTTARLVEILAAESREPSNLSSCLDLEITFLEFFEVLLGSAEVKCQQVSETLEGKSDIEPRIELPQTEKPSAQDEKSQRSVKTGINKEPRLSPERSEDKEKAALNRSMEANDPELQLWTESIHQFFNHFFFPAFECYQLESGT